jgi:hypothetical protein
MYLSVAYSHKRPPTNGIRRAPRHLQLIVVDIHNLLPFKLRVAGLGPSGKKIKSPDVGADACILGVVSKHTNASGLAELATFVIEVSADGIVSTSLVNELVNA